MLLPFKKKPFLERTSRKGNDQKVLKSYC